MVTYAPTIHALCGLTALSNPPGRGDVGAGFSLNDHAVGFTAAFSILAALEARRGSEPGQHVDISQLEVGAYLVGSALTDHLTNGRDAQATGNLDPYADHVVNDVFPTRDGEVAVTVRDAAEAAVVATVIGTPVEVVRDGLSQWCAGRSATEAMDTLQRAGVAAGRVQNADHLFTDDEQLAARGFFAMMPSTVFGARPFERFPARFGTSVLEPYRPAPNYVGEHAFVVLGELAGMDDAAVALAMADGLLA
jgi:crotonobetainyl-CoA:carnitine CoA-transferase CaiB-like acyl-CoA transferase